ncbi:MAG: putative manganese-dependent inorganic diphosphatase, partial [Clostridiales bacterium]|nr:putative manganese-dependent inorganic diphosphatase [Clostridiales bacterium]
SYKYDKLEGNLYIGSSAIYSHEEITDKDVVITAKIDTARKCALDLKCGCVIVVNNQIPDGLEYSEAGVVVSRKNIYDTIGLINQAISIKSVLRTGSLTTFPTDSYVEDITDIMRTSPHRNFPVIGLDGKFYGVISRRHLMDYSKKKVILIDHNEKSQSVEGLEQSSIVEIIDHHRIADVQTESPLFIRSEPVGCTATIITKIYKENKIPIDKKIAGLLLSAIISDTLMFSSPTCTSDDKASAEALAGLAGVSLSEYGRELFSAGTSLEGYTPSEILGVDSKKFTIGKYLIAISQINTLDFRGILNQKDTLLASMEELRETNRIDLVILMITDLIICGSEILVVGSNKAREIVTEAFGLGRHDNSIFLDGVVSRKKQMVPKLTVAATSF